MAKPYSYDLRVKVINAIELDGVKKSEASELFNISRNTINHGSIAKHRRKTLSRNQISH